MVVAINISVQITLKVKRANRVINAVNATLDSAPQRFAGVDVGNAGYILFGAMLDDFVSISKGGDHIVARKLISEDCTVFGYILPNHREQSPSPHIGNDFSDCLAVPLGHTHNHCFTTCTTPTLASMLTPNVSLINLDTATKGINVFGHEFANLLEHSPCRFVGDTQFPLKLFSRDTSFGRGHQEDSVKPGTERGFGLVEDSASRRGYLRAAEFAGIDLAVSDAVMESNLAAFDTEYAIRPSRGFKEIEASGLIGELLVKIFYGVGFHLVSPISTYTHIIAQGIRDVKG